MTTPDFAPDTDGDPKESLRASARQALARMERRGDEGDDAAQNAMPVLLDLFGKYADAPVIVGLYAAVRRELDTYPLIEQIRAAGGTVALPVMDTQNKTLSFYRWKKNESLVTGPHKIPAPAPSESEAPVIPNILILPLLAFDRTGTRLGSGGGYYDRTLAHFETMGHNMPCIGYAFDAQMCLFRLPRAPHDVQMDMVITPTRVHDFRA